MTAIDTASRRSRGRTVRRHVGEVDWRTLWAATPLGRLPDWVRPQRGPGPQGPWRDPGRLDPVVRDLAEIAARATTLVELRASVGCRGVLAAFAIDEAGVEVVGVKRELLSTDGSGTLRPLAGVDLAGLEVDALLDAVLRLVPPARDVPGREAVRLPADRAFALCEASRGDREELFDAMAAELGGHEPLGVLRSLARGVEGTADIRVGSAGGRVAASRTFASWLLTDEGWVSLRTRDGQVTHTPVRRSDIADAVLAELAGQLGRSRS